MTAKIYDFDKEIEKLGYVRDVIIGDMSGGDCIQYSNIESHGTIDPDSIIIIHGPLTLGDDDV